MKILALSCSTGQGRNATADAFAAIVLLLEGPLSFKLGCLLIAVHVNYKNWRDAHINFPRFTQKRD